MALKLADTGRGSRFEDIELSTGRKISANDHILGLPAFGPLALSEGYDGCIESEDGRLYWEDDNRFTVHEREEIAVHMIKRWAKWAGWIGDDTDTTQVGGAEGLD